MCIKFPIRIIIVKFVEYYLKNPQFRQEYFNKLTNIFLLAATYHFALCINIRSFNY